MSISDISAILTSANLKMSEATHVIAVANDNLIGALSEVMAAREEIAMAKGESETPLLNDSLGLSAMAEDGLRGILQRIEAIQISLRGSSEKNDEYIARLNG